MASRTNHPAPSKSPRDPRNGYVFVYGTLMRGQKLHHHLGKTVQFVGKGKIRAELYRLSARRYPAAITAPRSRRFVYGELYRMLDPARTLVALDRVEGCDEGLFERRLADVWVQRKKKRAWTYFFAQPLVKAEIVPTGRFPYQQASA